MTQQFDGLFMTGVQQCQGIDNFFDNLFGFFARKTDFYTMEDKAMTTVNQYLQKHITAFKADKAKQEQIENQRKAVADKAKAERAAKEAAAQRVADQKVADDAITMEITDEEAALIEAQEAARKANPAAATAIATEAAAATESKEAAADGEEEKKEEDENANKQKPNDANGGNCDNYNWEQSLGEVTVNVPIPEGTTSKMLTVDITKTHLKVGLKGQPLLIDGKFHKQVKKGESIWCLETAKNGSRILEISLTKKEGQNWWSCVIEGDTEINTQKVEPENSKLGDLDGETRSVVEKMMYDQRQKQAGLPSSDEQQKRGKLDEFMKAHPEMDFSKAKFS